MTGFGRGVAKVGDVRATVELRSVNQRFLRVGVRAAAHLAALEPRVRELLEAGALRGQIDAAITVEDGRTAPVARPDPTLVREYVKAWRKVGRELRVQGDIELGTLAAMPALFVSHSHDEAAENARPAVEKATAKALAALNRMRETEGKSLGQDLKARIGTIEQAAARIGKRADAAKPEYAKKLKARVEELLAEISAAGNGLLTRANLEREIAFFADRTDVSEELERIRSHIDQFRSALAEGSPAGRKLEFLVQEFQREITTLGSKVADAEAGREAVEFKSELEKIREQVQNLE
ncbi:MAG: YicC/YloC family endoribonuclease [Planctomycetota bacterium]|jgi:uncharacterized protein (TIGR00255 family)